MSRKSRLALAKEKLSLISDCPDEIFNKVEPCDSVFEKIECAKSGDVVAIGDLAEYLLGIYLDEEELNAALLFYARDGLLRGDRRSAIVMLKCMDRFNEQFEHLDAALALTDDASELDELRIRLKAKRAVYCAVHYNSYDSAKTELADIGKDYEKYARILLGSLIFKESGATDTECLAIAESLGLGNVLHLPTFTGRQDCDKNILPSVEVEEQIRYALSLIDMDEWQDFWIKIAYEYATLRIGGNLGDFIEDIISALYKRCDYPRRKLHLLAAKKYALDSLGLGDMSEFELLKEECLFNGLCFDTNDNAVCNELIREAVYTDSRAERESYHRSIRLGAILEHVKNRYRLVATMTNHIKRGYKHQWELTLSIATDKDKPPVILTGDITERMHQVTRGGVELNHEKKLSQVLCRSQLMIGDKVYPVEMDLILDISYVSSTKCGHCEIAIKNFKRDGEYLVMSTCLTIY